jgi:hypothetical protein
MDTARYPHEIFVEWASRYWMFVLVIFGAIMVMHSMITRPCILPVISDINTVVDSSCANTHIQKFLEIAFGTFSFCWGIWGIIK